MPQPTTPTREDEDAAFAAILEDEPAAAQAVFAPLLERLGREQASCVWAAALTRAEAVLSLDLAPDRCAPDCNGFCGQGTRDEDCAPCAALDAFRNRASDPYRCACGFAPSRPDAYEEIFDHVDECPRAAETA